MTKAIIYRIELLEPTLVTSLDGDPNSATAFDFLPGSALRGAVIGKYIQKEKSKNPVYQFAAEDEKIQRLFFNGETRYLNGYLLDDEKRTLPTPLSWQREKGNEKEIRDFAVEDPQGDEYEIQWQSINQPFCKIVDEDAAMVHLVNPERYLSIHTARDRKYGRAREGSGAVYRYEALAKGQVFETAILCDNDADATELLSLIEGEARLGGSRSGGYGRVRFDKASKREHWREATRSTGDKLIITLLSDALLRDENGQFVVDKRIVKAELEKQLNCNLSEPRVFMRGRIIGGFNRKWGLPLPQSLVVQMGSVFAFDQANCDENALNVLEESGIGERRAEGFGRIAINWHAEEDQLHVSRSVPVLKVQTVSLSPEGQRLASRMAERLSRRRLDNRLIEKANHIKMKEAPKNSQLSRLRGLIQDELLSAKTDLSDISSSIQRVTDYLNAVKSRSTVSRQFQKARVDGISLLNWLEQKLQATSEEKWRDLFDFRSEDIPRVGGVKYEMNDAIRTEYMLRLIDAVLARATKQKGAE